MDYAKLSEFYEKLESTTKRLEKTYWISELLKNTPTEDLDKITLLIQGKVFPSYDPRKIGIAAKLIVKTLNIATGLSTEKIEKIWKDLGDLGETAEMCVERKSQQTLFSQKLNVKKVFDNLQKLSTIEGTGTVDLKLKLLSELLTSSSPIEAKYIVRTVLEELRVGVGEGSLRDAIAWAFFPKVVGIFFKCEKCEKIMPNTKKCIECGAEIKNKYNEETKKSDNKNILKIDDIYSMKDIENYDFIQAKDEKIARECYNYFINLVQESIDITNDFGTVAKTAKTKGRGGLLDVKLKIGNPIKVMLYPKAKNIKDAFERVGKPAALEYKYDGFRLQIHKTKGKITLFTRRLENVTKQFPDVVKFVENNIDCEEFIIDSEAVGFEPSTGKYIAFQNISQRIRRKYDINKMAKEFPVELNIFDIVNYNGESVLKKPFKERREILEKMVKQKEKEIVLAKQIITSDESEAEKFYNESLDAGEEGAMAKNLEGIYKPGSRVGYGVKIKPVMETLDLVIVGGEWGHGKRAGWISSFMLACYDPESGRYLEIGKVGTGFKELEGEGLTFAQLTEMLKPLIKEEKGSEVKIRPAIIIEVNYEEIQKSPTYSSGYALRFPRLVKLREDKGLDEINTLEDVEVYYAQQRGRGK